MDVTRVTSIIGQSFSDVVKPVRLLTQDCHQIHVLYDFLVTVKAAPHECVIRTGQP